jgi:hypothetical protein
MQRGKLALLAVSGLMFASHSPVKAQTHSTWSDYAGASDASQYSALAQMFAN